MNATFAQSGAGTVRLTPWLRTAAVAGILALLTGCGVVDATGSVVGGAVDLTVDAVDTTTDVVTAPL